MTFSPGQPLPFEKQKSDNRIIKETTVYQGVVIEVSTNLDTGEVNVKSVKTGTVIAESKNNNYTINSSSFLGEYNNTQRNIGGVELSESDLIKEIERIGLSTFNEIRADLINENASLFKRRQLSVSGIPGVIDSITGGFVNSRGLLTSSVISPSFLSPSNEVVSPASESSLSFEDGIDLLDSGFSLNSAFDFTSPAFERPRSSRGKFEILKYPEYDISEFGYDYIFIQRYKVTQGDAANKPGNPSTIIQLPMQPNLQEDNGAEWGEDKLNTIQNKLADIGIDAIPDNFTLEDIKNAIKNLIKNLGNMGKDIINDDGLQRYITSYFAGQAVGDNIFSRDYGTVINPNLELLYNEPKIRSFNFNFKFTPRTDTEAEIIKKIIRELKSALAPKAPPPYYFVYSPDVFKLKYKYNGGIDHPFMHRFKERSILSDFSVNYTPSNSYMTYKDSGSMTQYEVKMTFSELEPVYEDDQKGAGGTGF